MSWGAATDDLAVAGYRLLRDGVEIASFDASGAGYEDRSVVAGAAYTYALVAFDTSGNASDPLDATRSVEVPVPASTLFLYYTFEEGVGDLVVDQSEAGNDGLIGDGAFRNPEGVAGGAVEATGTGGRVELGTLDVQSVDALTIMLWMKADDFGTSDARLLSKSTGSGANDHVFMLSTVSGPHLRGRLRSGGSTTTVVGDQGLLPAGAWVHAAMTYDGEALRLYQNGVLVGSQPMTGPIDLDPTMEAWLLANPGDAGQVFDGAIDEVKLFAAALSASEIQAERLDTEPPIPPPPAQVPGLPPAALWLVGGAMLAVGLRRLRSVGG